MTEILFYHLTESRLEEALPALLEKTLSRGWRASVHCGSDERVAALDEYLWTYRDDSFLAHGTDKTDFASEQPVLLTCQSSADNDAHVKFVVDRGPEPDFETSERVVFMFDGHDQAQVDQARVQWKALSDSDLDKTYWQQTPEGRWVKKA